MYAAGFVGSGDFTVCSSQQQSQQGILTNRGIISDKTPSSSTTKKIPSNPLRYLHEGADIEWTSSMPISSWRRTAPWRRPSGCRIWKGRSSPTRGRRWTRAGWTKRWRWSACGSAFPWDPWGRGRDGESPRWRRRAFRRADPKIGNRC